jgi:hypothetical protein
MSAIRGSLAACVLVASIAAVAAQTGGGSSGGSSSGGASSGSSAGGSTSRGSSAPGAFSPQQAQPRQAQPSTTGGAAVTQPPAIQGANPSVGVGSGSGNPASGAASPGSAQGLHPAQRDQPSDNQQQKTQQQKDTEKNEPDPTRQSSGGNPPGDSTTGTDIAPGGSKAGGSVLALNDAAKEKVRRVIRSYSIAPPERANFPLRLGATVPANVDLKPLPPEVASVVPDYKNYSYVVTPGQIAIVITEKREIDLLIPS